MIIFPGEFIDIENPQGNDASEIIMHINYMTVLYD